MRENQTSNVYKREGSKKELFLTFVGNGQEFHEPSPLVELSLSLSLSHVRKIVVSMKLLHSVKSEFNKTKLNISSETEPQVPN